MSMGRSLAGWLLAALILLAMAGCGGESSPDYDKTESTGADNTSVVVPSLDGTALEGEELFNTNCSTCHGQNAVGTSQGPPLLHRTYVPGHHPDLSFHNAVRNGVWQHHWSFGEMPPVGAVTPEEVDKVICYVREMQRANGIFESDAEWSTC